jgi:hypothetical protein
MEENVEWYHVERKDGEILLTFYDIVEQGVVFKFVPEDAEAIGQDLILMARLSKEDE